MLTFRVQHISIVLIFLLFFLFITVGRSNGNMVCKVHRSAMDPCTPHLLLETADLTISGQDTFWLQGRYSACFHQEDVTILGKVNRISYYDGMDLELLATEVRQPSDYVVKFPRTIGVVRLNKMPLAGRFVDIWASIRNRGGEQQDPSPLVIRCANKE